MQLARSDVLTRDVEIELAHLNPSVTKRTDLPPLNRHMMPCVKFLNLPFWFQLDLRCMLGEHQ
jgi:hypothetical protein